MGQIKIPEGVSSSQFLEWAKNTREGQSFLGKKESMANKGLSSSWDLSNAPVKQWLDQREAGGASQSSTPDMSAYSPQASFQQQSSTPDMSAYTYKPNPYVSEGQFRNMFSGGQAQPRQQSFGTPYGWRERPKSQPPVQRVPESMPAPRQTRVPKQPMGDALLPPGWSFGPNGERLPPPRTPTPRPAAPPSSPSNATPETPQRSPYAIDYAVSPQAFPAPPAEPPQTAPQFDFGSMFNNYFNQLPQPRQPSFSVQTTPGFSQPAAPLPTPSFQQQTRNFDGSVSETPNFNLRDAFVQNINESLLPYQMGKKSGPPQFDFSAMLSKAGEMANTGYQNPLAALLFQ